ncbi:tetratricopeptide repeat protein [Methanosarcina sp. Mfa9]|uniref:tetratricopeptide repeat protein n=1 Tax=Methanosarcina sp. Mfa9 TaxID=3439063 RepID=UPI003F850044
MALFGLEKYPEAIEALDKALELNPDYPDAWYQKGVVLFKLEKYPEAIEALDKALRINSDYPDAWYQKGIVLFKLEKYPEAIETFDKALELNPDYPDAWYCKASSLLFLNNHIEAIDAFEKSVKTYENRLKKNPDDVLGLWKKGITLYNIDKFDEAKKSFNEAIRIYDAYLKIHPEDYFYRRKGFAHFYNGEYKEAIKAFDKLNNNNNNNNNNDNNNITCKKFKSIASYLDMKSTKNNFNSEKTPIEKEFLVKALKKEVLIHCKNEEYTKALRDIEEILSFEPKDAYLWNDKGLALYCSGKYYEAIEAFEMSIRIRNATGSGPIAETWNNKGLALYYSGKYIEALDSFEEAIRINPVYAEAWNNKGLAFCELKVYDKALETFENAIKIYPNNVFAHIYMGKLFVNFGDFDAAFKKVEDAFRVNTNNNSALSQAWCLKGQIHLEKLKYEDAIYSFEKAISYDAVNPYFILWYSYARYLKSEFSSKSFNSEEITKNHKENILLIIRDLEKIIAFFDKSENYPKYQKWISSIKSYIKYIFSFFKRPPVIKSCKDMYDSKSIEANALYLMGCLYYKINDIFSAMWKLEECTKLKSGGHIQKSAHKLIDNIWDYRIKPYVSWWNWWLNSPVHRWPKRIMFIFLTSLTFKLLRLEEYLINIFKGKIPENVNFLDLIQFSLLVFVLIFILLSPSIKSFKGKDIEIELQQQSPPPIEFYPFMPPFKFERISIGSEFIEDCQITLPDSTEYTQLKPDDKVR